MNKNDQNNLLPEKSRKRLGFIIDVFYAAMIAALCYLGLRLASLLFPFLLAVALVALLSPVTRFINRKLHVSSKAVSIILMALLYAGAGTLIIVLVVNIVLLLRDLFSQIPVYYQTSLEPALNNLSLWLENLLERFPLEWTTMISAIEDSLTNALSELVSTVSSVGINWAGSVVNRVPSFFVSLMFTILFSFFVSVYYKEILDFVKAQLPENAQDKADELKILFKNTVLKYLKATLILMFCTFLELAVGFLVCGIGNPFGKALGIAIFDALPIFGTGGIMIPWVIIELLSGHTVLALKIAVLYVIVTVVRNLIEPKVIGDQLGLNPVVSLISIYLGYRLVGVVGMIAFPILAQILAALHQNGTIRLYRTKSKADEPEKSTEKEPDK